VRVGRQRNREPALGGGGLCEALSKRKRCGAICKNQPKGGGDSRHSDERDPLLKGKKR